MCLTAALPSLSPPPPPPTRPQVYGEATALVSVGYEYVTCSSILWETQTATLHGFHMDVSNVGGWNLDIHHMYNFEAGECVHLASVSVYLDSVSVYLCT